MESLTDTAVETIEVVEDTDGLVIVEDAHTPITRTPARRAGDKPLVTAFADDPFVVDWAPPQS
jgi:hypothetical protein